MYVYYIFTYIYIFTLAYQAYTMRSAVVTSIGHIIVHRAQVQATTNQNDDEPRDEALVNAENKTRDDLLDILQERALDVNGYTRSAVLRTWTHVCEQRAVPLARMQAVTAMANGRLRDKTALVRKSAGEVK